MSADDDYKLLDHGIGFTNIVERPTRGSQNLLRKEIIQGGRVTLTDTDRPTASLKMTPLSPLLIAGAQSLLEKVKKYRPKIVVFNGKGIYEVFSGKKDFHFGKQPDKIDGTDTVSSILREHIFVAYCVCVVQCMAQRLTVPHANVISGPCTSKLRRAPSTACVRSSTTYIYTVAHLFSNAPLLYSVNHRKWQ